LDEQLLHIGQEGVKAAEQLLAAMEVGRVDLLQARIEADSTMLRLHAAQTRHRAAWRRLAAVVGLPDMEPARLAGDLEGEIPEFTWEEALRRLLAESPELAVAHAGVRKARCALELQCAQRVPDVDLETAVRYHNVTRDTLASVQVGLPLPIFNRNQGNICKAQAELVSAENEVRRIELALHDRLAEAFQKYANARRQVEVYSAEILPRAQETLTLVRSGYSLGEFDYLTLLTAQRTYFQANLSYVESLRELRLGLVDIEGMLLRGGLATERSD
jgi:cobalt-zinc-cadmium efflux system outer membrane protein